MHERHYRLFIPCLIGLADSASASGTRAAQMEQPQGYFVLFVGRRYYLRPIIHWNARRATGTAAGSGTREAQLERPQAIGTPQVSSLLLSAFPLTLKCVNFVNFVNFL